ncbi:hypothetical protein VR010_06590 [Actinomycetaceae bacterium L2_0104]
MLGSQERVCSPRMRRRRIASAGLLIFAICIVQALCHSTFSAEGAPSSPVRAVILLDGTESASVPHTDPEDDQCSSAPTDSSCADSLLTSCLLILFLSAGLSIPQRFRPGTISGRFVTAASPRVRSIDAAPDLHALGISRT